MSLLVTSLQKSFPDPESGRSLLALDIERFELKSGEECALAGSSGCGKSTFLNLAAGLLRADQGQIFVAGEEMSALPEWGRDALRARKIGYIFQSFHLLPALTAWENVQLGLSLAGGGATVQERGRELLEQVGLGHRLHHRPAQLSVGQRQRVAVARALAHRPELLLADEPTGNLDALQAQAVMELIRSLCHQSGTALLLVSHDREVLSQFGRVEEFAQINRALRGAA